MNVSPRSPSTQGEAAKEAVQVRRTFDRIVVSLNLEMVDEVAEQSLYLQSWLTDTVKGRRQSNSQRKQEREAMQPIVSSKSNLGSTSFPSVQRREPSCWRSQNNFGPCLFHVPITLCPSTPLSFPNCTDVIAIRCSNPSSQCRRPVCLHDDGGRCACTISRSRTQGKRG